MAAKRAYARHARAGRAACAGGGARRGRAREGGTRLHTVLGGERGERLCEDDVRGDVPRGEPPLLHLDRLRRLRCPRLLPRLRPRPHFRHRLHHRHRTSLGHRLRPFGRYPGRRLLATVDAEAEAIPTRLHRRLRLRPRLRLRVGLHLGLRPQRLGLMRRLPPSPPPRAVRHHRHQHAIHRTSQFQAHCRHRRRRRCLCRCLRCLHCIRRIRRIRHRRQLDRGRLALREGSTPRSGALLDA